MAPKRKAYKPPRNYVQQNIDDQYWSNLHRVSAYLKVNYQTQKEQRLQRRTQKREEQRLKFLTKYKMKRKRGRPSSNMEIVKCLCYWIQYHSWGYCPKCFLLCTFSLIPKCFNSKGAKYVTKCICAMKKYVVPMYSLIPLELKGLTQREERILRVFEIDIGPKKVAPMGNRVKNGAFELRYRKDTVLERINSVKDIESRHRLQRAYDYLLQSHLSCYKLYINHQIAPHPDKIKIKFWDVYQNYPGVECALWPVLYPFSCWCESLLQGTKDSILISFRVKLLSSIVDYNNNFALLQFHYDKWLFKTISAAVNVGKRMKTSPARALETKHFSSSYWQWQHYFLQDAVLQFGYPTFFLTISPYEWDFPKPKWVESALLSDNLLPTACGPMETMNIAHVLQQMMKGYITGCNAKDWDTHEFKHVFCNITKHTPSNVLCVFFRFEYQNRRCIHTHMLVWLSDVSKINLQLLSATIPSDNEELAFLVHRIQPSDQSSPFLDVSNNPNYVSDDRVILYHTKHDNEVNLRAYINTVLPVLNSRMDVQGCDGKAALMQYVCTYATKLSHSAQILKSTSTTAFQVALPFLIDAHPGEPEMAMAFASTPMSYCNLSRVKLVPPVSEEYFEKSVIFQKYLKRPDDASHLTCLQFCRQYHISKACPTPLKDAQNLVGVKYKYIFVPQFLFQYVIVNTPFRNLKDLQHPQHHLVPPHLIPISYMYQNHHDFLLDPDKITSFLKVRSYKTFKIKQFLSYKDGLVFIFLKSLNDGKQVTESEIHLQSLGMDQSLIYHHIIEKLTFRASLVSTCHLSEDESEEENEVNWSDNFEEESDNESLASDIFDSSSDSSSHTDHEKDDDRDDDGNSDHNSDDTDFFSKRPVHVKPKFYTPDTDDIMIKSLRPVIITGSPGTGKTHILRIVVKYCLDKELKVLFACPTAHQARNFLSTFPHSLNITADTIHSLFHIPVDPCGKKMINWSLLKYDVLVVDEVAMVSLQNMNHVYQTLTVLPVCPLLIMSGDEKQQQPLESTEEGNTTTTLSILNSHYFLKRCDSFKLYKNIRSSCYVLKGILHEIRLSYPSYKTLDMLNNTAYCHKGHVSFDHVVRAFRDHPCATFLTVTRKGSFLINSHIISYLFQKQEPLARNINVGEHKIHIYEGMKIIITKNICKVLGIVNGECGVIEDFRYSNVIITLRNGTRVFLHPIIDDDDEEGHEYYPFLPDYSGTIFRNQGKTLPFAIIWLDANIASPGAAYVAISRVACHKDFAFLERVDCRQVCPIPTTE